MLPPFRGRQMSLMYYDEDDDDEDDDDEDWPEYAIIDAAIAARQAAITAGQGSVLTKEETKEGITGKGAGKEEEGQSC